MLPHDKIDGDLNCIDCGYNLRGLPVNHRCPECGVPTILSATRAERTLPPGDRLYIPLAADVGGTVDGVLFVQDCVRHALCKAAQRAGRRAHVGAREVCDSVREYALAYFNDQPEALELLAEWRVCCSEDVGRIVFAFVRNGLMRLRPNDSEHDFAGLFTLETLFAPSEDAG